MSRDRYGLEYSDLLVCQKQHLQIWTGKLLPEVATEIAEYVTTHNKQAGLDGKHQVFRGQDIIQLVLDWPTPGPGYPPRIENLI